MSAYEASQEIEKAINRTLQRLFDHSEGSPASPSHLFKALRYPTTEARNLAKAAEIYDRTIEILHKKAINNNQQNSSMFSYATLLTASQLRLIANVSGCLKHNDVPTCSDMCFHSKYRTIDGTCNNYGHPWWGASLTAFHRHLPPQYENGLHTPIGWSGDVLYNGFKKPNPRVVSTSIIMTENITSDHLYTHMLMQWGQFLDHDIDFSLPAISHASFQDAYECYTNCNKVPPCFPIEVLPDDNRLKDGRLKGNPVENCIEFVRSSAVCGSGETSLFLDNVFPREQVNQLTSFIDASNIYGSTSSVANLVRDFSFPNHGLLRVQSLGSPPQTLLPYATDFLMDCQRDRDNRHTPCFLAGDVRANEQLGLLSMHTIWAREHNRIARGLGEINSHWDGDTLYQETRKIVGAQMQHITYNHWLPKVLGTKGMELVGKYEGYEPSINPTIANVFATAALRFGHTLINPVLTRLNRTFQVIPDGNVPLHKAFFAPHRLIDEGGVDPLMRGLFYTPAKIRRSDQLLNSELIDNLFTLARTVALDLAAVNIQRGRDHGIPGYNEWRKFCNLKVAETFEDLKQEIKSVELRDKLKLLYGHPANIDVWVGAVSEELMEGARVGPTFACLLADQFKRLRAGDRFWYENPGVFRPDQLTQIKQISLGKVLCNSGDNITEVTKDVFSIPAIQNPSIMKCQDVPGIELKVWTECCHDCANSGIFSSVTKVGTRIRRNAQQNDVSFISERPLNATSAKNNEPVKVEDHSLLDMDIDEMRIEGMEDMLHQMYKAIKQLNKKIKRLENECHIKNACIDEQGISRKNGEHWKVNCKQCSCTAGKSTCSVLPECLRL